MQDFAQIIRRTDCCGIRLLYGIAELDPLDVMFTVCNSIANSLEYRDSSHFSFSDNTGEDNAYGDILRDAILEEGLGVVVETEFARNPNSRNLLKAYIWTPDREACTTWFNNADARARQENPLENSRFAVGDFVRFTRNSPNYFAGRGVIERADRLGIHITTDRNTRVSIRPEELENLTETRAFNNDN